MNRAVLYFRFQKGRDKIFIFMLVLFLILRYVNPSFFSHTVVSKSSYAHVMIAFEASRAKFTILYGTMHVKIQIILLSNAI